MAKKNVDDKRNLIVDAAKRRFSHYGMAKTTMAEIAKDLTFSKALLYYYFPDKVSLYIAVLESVIDEYNEETEATLATVQDTEEALMVMLNNRIEFIKRYYYIIEYTYDVRKEVHQEVDAVFTRLFQDHIAAIKNILQQGIDRGELRPADVDELAQIFVYSTIGLRLMVVKDMKIDFIPTEEGFAYVIEMQKKLAKVFIDGLRK